MFKIDKGVPFTDGRKNGRPSKYPWNRLEVGDSFVVEDQSRNTMAATARYHTVRTGKTFKAATEGKTVRVWRLS